MLIIKICYYSFIICLTDSKTMLLVCAFTFLPVKEWNKVPISDFTVMQEMGTTSVLLLTNEIQPSLMLVSMPGNLISINNLY